VEATQSALTDAGSSQSAAGRPALFSKVNVYSVLSVPVPFHPAGHLASEEDRLHASKDTHADQDLGDGQGVELDETDPSNEVVFGGEDQIRSQLIGTTRFCIF
jgi:hypothetical protein